MMASRKLLWDHSTRRGLSRRLTDSRVEAPTEQRAMQWRRALDLQDRLPMNEQGHKATSRSMIRRMAHKKQMSIPDRDGYSY